MAEPGKPGRSLKIAGVVLMLLSTFLGLATFVYGIWKVGDSLSDLSDTSAQIGDEMSVPGTGSNLSIWTDVAPEYVTCEANDEPVPGDATTGEVGTGSSEYQYYGSFDTSRGQTYRVICTSELSGEYSVSSLSLNDVGLGFVLMFLSFLGFIPFVVGLVLLIVGFVKSSSARKQASGPYGPGPQGPFGPGPQGPFGPGPQGPFGPGPQGAYGPGPYGPGPQAPRGAPPAPYAVPPPPSAPLPPGFAQPSFQAPVPPVPPGPPPQFLAPEPPVQAAPAVPPFAPPSEAPSSDVNASPPPPPPPPGAWTPPGGGDGT